MPPPWRRQLTWRTASLPSLTRSRRISWCPAVGVRYAPDRSLCIRALTDTCRRSPRARTHTLLSNPMAAAPSCNRLDPTPPKTITKSKYFHCVCIHIRNISSCDCNPDEPELAPPSSTPTHKLKQDSGENSQSQILLHLFVACIERGNDRYTLYLITLKFYILSKTNNYAFITLGSEQEGAVHTLVLTDSMLRCLAATTQGCGRDKAHVLPRGGSDCVGAALGIDNLSFTACQRLLPRVRRLLHTCYATFRCICLNGQHHSMYE